MPWPSPASPLVRAKIRSWGALWTPVFHSCSTTRRPTAASSTERSAPDRCAAAWPMHRTPHCQVFCASHQRKAARSAVVPDAAS